MEAGPAGRGLRRTRGKDWAGDLKEGRVDAGWGGEMVGHVLQGRTAFISISFYCVPAGEPRRISDQSTICNIGV